MEQMKLYSYMRTFIMYTCTNNMILWQKFFFPITYLCMQLFTFPLFSNVPITWKGFVYRVARLLNNEKLDGLTLQTKQVVLIQSFFYDTRHAFTLFFQVEHSKKCLALVLLFYLVSVVCRFHVVVSLWFCYYILINFF